MLSTAVTCLFFAAHHASPTAFGADEFSLFMGRVGQFPHLDFATSAEHWPLPHIRLNTQPNKSLVKFRRHTDHHPPVQGNRLA